ncbi:hypothetical protein GJ496_006716 [Pomphorhynchus laevis]|nr:hypothetical protein GJ496_006716 [Pomphorhynchus laevis]
MKKILGLLLIAIVVLAGCSGSKDPLVFKRATSEVEGLDISQASYSQSFDLYEAIFEGLYVINKDGEIEPGGATELPMISEDGMTYTIKLKDNVKWVDSSGEEKGTVTANDYIFAWKRMVDPETGASYSYIYDMIEGYEEAAAGDLDKLGVKALDDTTIEIKLAYPAPYFTSMLAFGSFNPIAEESVKAATDAGDTYAATEKTVWYNGPFYVEKFDKTGTIKTVKNEKYWDVANVTLNGVEYVFMKDSNTQFTAFQSNEVDYATIPSPEQHSVAKESFPESLKERKEAGTMVLYFNNESGDTTNVNLRKAIQSSINTAEIADNIYGGGTKAADTFVPGELTESAYDVNFKDLTGSLSAFDIEAGKAYLAKAEEELGKKANEMNLTFLLASGDTNKTLAEYIQSQLTANLGINVTIEQLDQSAYSDKRNSGNFDIVYGGWSSDYGDAGNFLGLFQSAFINGLNTSRYSSTDFDEAFKKANQEKDPVSRNAQFAVLETRIVKDEAVLVPLVKRGKDVLVSPKFNFYTDPVYKVSSKFITVNE